MTSFVKFPDPAGALTEAEWPRDPVSKALTTQWLSDFSKLSDKCKNQKDVETLANQEFLPRLNQHLLSHNFIAGTDEMIKLDSLALTYLESLNVKLSQFPACSRWAKSVNANSKLVKPQSLAELLSSLSIAETPAFSKSEKPETVSSGATAAKTDVKAAAGAGKDSKSKSKSKEPKKAADPKPEASDKSNSGPSITDLDLRVGQIVSIDVHPERPALYVEQITFGEERRTIISGLVEFYPDKSVLKGKKVIVVMNLKPRNMGCVTSAGMVLCASNQDKSKVELLQVPEGVELNEKISFDGVSGEPLTVNRVAKGKVLEKLLASGELKTDAKGVAIWGSHKFLTPKGEVRAPTIFNGSVS